jgi:hypothetical protein
MESFLNEKYYNLLFRMKTKLPVSILGDLVFSTGLSVIPKLSQKEKWLFYTWEHLKSFKLITYFMVSKLGLAYLNLEGKMLLLYCREI